MPDWAWVVGAGAVLLIAAGAAIGILIRRRYARRTLVRLIARAEAVDAAGDALSDVARQVGEGGYEAAEAFAMDPDSVERRALAEVHNRAAILVDELDVMPMPKQLVPVAEALADAAYAVREQAGCVKDGHVGPEALEAFAAIDLELVANHRKKARILISEACERLGLDETAVYGGGLYL
jgi:hypothetical protein